MLHPFRVSNWRHMVNLEVFIAATVGGDLTHPRYNLKSAGRRITPPSFSPRSMDGHGERQMAEACGRGRSP